MARDRNYEISRTDLIAARATASGPGAIAIVRVDGEGAGQLVEGFFKSKGTETISASPRLAIFGTWHGAEGGGPDAEPIDEGLCIYFKAPHSFTGNDLVELQCHGGPVVARRLLAELIRRGSRLAQPGEFTRRAFMNGRVDLTQAEAVADLITAETDSAARTAERQLAGGLSKEVGRLREGLIDLAAEIEARIDFPDEGIEPVDLERLTENFETSAAGLERLLATRRHGRLLREGATVALVGPPNVGKSSLLNALCRSERAIVTPHPGTTRDTLEATVDLAGIAVTLIDTAGLREAEGPVEKIGIARTREVLRGADLVVEVRDASAPPASSRSPSHSEASSFSVDRAPDLIAENKIDLVKAKSEGEAEVEDEASLAETNGTANVRVSAKSGEGLESLENAIATALEGEGSGILTSESAINERHAVLIEAGLVSLASARAAWDADLGHELVTIDLREALAALDEILGLAPGEAVLDRIFEQFCLGK